LPAALPQPRHLTLAGGVSAVRALEPLWERLSKVKGLSFDLLPLPNAFFGPAVNVSGLLTGSCLLKALGGKGLQPGAAVYLPEIMLRDRKDCFLDGLTVAEVSEALGLRLIFLPSAGDRLLAKLLPARGRKAAGKSPAKRLARHPAADPVVNTAADPAINPERKKNP
jgi:NifB/MoaA-like Fe-S oxidoreductase